MKRLSVGLVLMLLCTLSIFAQNKVISVSGRVVESDSKEPAAQATVQLLSLPDSAYAAGIASSNKGWFTLPKVKAGKYLLKISYIGFRTKFVPVQLSNNVPEKKMGNIALEPDAVMSKASIITAELFSFISTWNSYFWPLVMTNSDEVRPLTLAMQRLQDANQGLEWPVLMAGNTLIVLPVLLLFLLLSRQILVSFGYKGMK